MEKIDETSSLIAGSRVSGTKVYNPKSEHIGEIQDVMIDKASGKVVYAIMSFGGFLGIGQDYRPLPWKLLKYDVSLGGYVVDIAKSDLEKAPAYPADAAPQWGDRTYKSRLHDYYGVGPYWI